jgi:hypothetical protein
MLKAYFDYLVILNKKLICADYTAQSFTNENLQRAYGEALGDIINQGKRGLVSVDILFFLSDITGLTVTC